MNKKILISLCVIGAVAAIVIGGTVAFFSDTETSTGNTFTAGTLDLTIDNECSLNGIKCIQDNYGEYRWDLNGDGVIDMPEADPQNKCSCTWELDDLDGKLFFDFSDLKPGDWGEDTVSLHVTNDAWACVTFDNLASADNSCTEPEAEAEGGACDTDGELAQELNFVFWEDMCSRPTPLPAVVPGDNIYQPGCEGILMQGFASDVLNGRTYPIADSLFSIVQGGPGQYLPLVGNTTYYIGKAWCFGEMEINESVTAPIICNGAPVDNAAQTDSLTGTIEFYAEQWRNNPNFTCGEE